MISKDELHHVDLSGLRKRLIGYGWAPMKRPGLLRAPTGKYYTLPSSLEDELDYVSLDLVIDTLFSEGHVRKLSELTHLIEGRKKDLLRLGCEIDGVSPGLIPVVNAPSFYKKTSGFLRTSSISLQQDRKLTGKKGMFERLYYGRTVEASYMVEVHVPVDTIPDPLGRAFVRKTVAVASSLLAAVESQDERQITNSTAASWTAAMCESIIDFAADPVFSHLKIQAIPDPIWTDSEPLETREFVVPLRNSGVTEVLERASASLRGLKQSQYVEVVGIPYASRDEAIIGESEKRTVSVLWRREGLSPVKVRAELGQKAYEFTLASQSKRLIHLKGWLRQDKGRWVLDVDGMPTLLDEMEIRPNENDPFAIEEEAIIDDLQT